MFALMTRAVVILTIISTVAASTTNVIERYRQWTITQRLRDTGLGQPGFNYSDSMHVLGRYIAVGSTSAAGGRGMARILYDAGNGFELLTTVVDPNGRLGDMFGACVLLFNRKNVMHVAVGATKKSVDGAVFVYRSFNPGYWPLQQVLTREEGDFADNFGRWIGFDGNLLLISAVSRYQISTRFVISALNVKGTRNFIESTGIDPIPGDPIFVFITKDGRFNSTSLKPFQTLRDAPYTLDFGNSVALDKDMMLVGASFRQESRYGYGTDGDLIVLPGQIKLLDGSAVYNFRNIEIFSGGILSVDVFDTIRGAGGWLQLKVQDTLRVHPGGQINVSTLGYPGSRTFLEQTPSVKGFGPGAGFTATSIYVNDLSCNYDNSDTTTARKRNSTSSVPYAEANGGGGSYATSGLQGVKTQCGDSGLPGPIYGQADLQKGLYRGSGGGSGHPWKVGSGGKGGDGGGVIHIVARRLINQGIIAADGGKGGDGSFYSGGGGGGSGGSILLSGASLDNSGYIFARGGAGGVASSTSGSVGNPAVHGGRGGSGRVHLEFITTVSTGIVVPRPNNITTYEGAIYLYRKSATTGRWNFTAVIPRQPGMMFIGHSVALNNGIAAIASDEMTDKSPVQRVYYMDISGVKNGSSPIYRKRIFYPPGGSGDLNFGFSMKISNGSLLVAADGRGVTRGVVYLFQGGDLFKRVEKLTSFVSGTSRVGDNFGLHIDYQYPLMLLHVPFDQDDNPAPSTRRSIGNIQVLRHVRNISTEKSFITCDYTLASANTTVNCQISTRDAFGAPVGELNDLSFFTFPPNLVFVSRGTYRFQTYIRTTGPRQIYAMYRGQRIKNSATITATAAIDASLSNLTCTPTTVVAGRRVTCTIKAFPVGAGEANAAANFLAVVYNAGDQGLTVAQPDVDVFSHGLYKGPLSRFIQTDPLQYDFPTVVPTVSFQRRGVYQFSFTPWREGPFAAFVMYRNRALRFPNPVIVDATTPAIDSVKSLVDCPAIASPNRTVVCVIYLRDANGIPAGAPNLAANFSNPRYFIASVGGVTLPVQTLWSGEGRISVLMRSPQTGIIAITARYKGTTLPVNPPSGISVQTQYAQSCRLASVLLDSFTAVKQHVMGKGDVTVLQVATLAQYQTGAGFCDAPMV